MAFVPNKLADFEKNVCSILAQLAHFVHPDVLHRIQQGNKEEYSYFKGLFGNRIEISEYLFEGSACVFPGVKRYVAGRGDRRKYNPNEKAIIDDNAFPRHLWCYLAIGKPFNGPNWKAAHLDQFEIAHIFAHKGSELSLERDYFTTVEEKLQPHGQFTCAGNIVLIPEGMVRPTDKSPTTKAVFFKRFVELYGEAPLNGRSGFKESLLPDWYRNLRWNDPVVPHDWESKVDKLLAYRKKTIAGIIERAQRDGAWSA